MLLFSYTESVYYEIKRHDFGPKIFTLSLLCTDYISYDTMYHGLHWQFGIAQPKIERMTTLIHGQQK